MAPYKISQGDIRSVFDRATGQRIGSVMRHHTDGLWDWHEARESGVDGDDEEHALGYAWTMDDAAAALHAQWVSLQFPCLSIDESLENA